MKALLQDRGGDCAARGCGRRCVFYWNPLWVNDEMIRYRLWRAGVRSEYVDAGGYRIHTFEAAPPDGSAGIPLVLVHGLGSRGEDWEPMIPRLAAAGFHVYAPDLLGYGRSAKPDVVESVAVEEVMVVGFLDAVGVTRADFDGWSMGGWIAAKIALEHPEMVDRLVVDDSAGLTFQPCVCARCVCSDGRCGAGAPDGGAES